MKKKNNDWIFTIQLIENRNKFLSLLFFFFGFVGFFFCRVRWTKKKVIYTTRIWIFSEWVRNWVRERQAHTCDLLPRYQSIVVLLILIVRRIRNLSLGRHGPSTLSARAHSTRSLRWFDVCLDARRREGNQGKKREIYTTISSIHTEPPIITTITTTKEEQNTHTHTQTITFSIGTINLCAARFNCNWVISKWYHCWDPH